MRSAYYHDFREVHKTAFWGDGSVLYFYLSWGYMCVYTYICKTGVAYLICCILICVSCNTIRKERSREERKGKAGEKGGEGQA